MTFVALPSNDNPRTPKWQVRSSICRLVNRYMGRGEWRSGHYRLASRLMHAWEHEGVHYNDLERYLRGEIPNRVNHW